MIKQLFALSWILAALIFTGCATFGIDGQVAGLDEKPDSAVDMAEQFDRRRNVAQFKAAENRWNQGDTKASEKLLTSLLSRDPDHVQAKQLLADVYTSQKRTDEALAQWENLLAKSPDNAQYHHSIGLVHHSAGNEEKAQLHFQKAIALDPQNPAFQFLLNAGASSKIATPATVEVATPERQTIDISAAQSASSSPVTINLSD